MMEIVPNLILVIFLIAFVLMVLACFCAYKAFRIASETFLVVYNLDRALYKSILGNRDASWIERKAGSLSDISLWWKYYKMLYFDERVLAVVGHDNKIKFTRYVSIMLIGYFLAIFLAVAVLAVGFMLANQY